MGSICKVGNIFHLASVLALIEVFILICLIIARFVTKGFDDNATKVILLAVAIIGILILYIPSIFGSPFPTNKFVEHHILMVVLILVFLYDIFKTWLQIKLAMELRGRNNTGYGNNREDIYALPRFSGESKEERQDLEKQYSSFHNDSMPYISKPSIYASTTYSSAGGGGGSLNSSTIKSQSQVTEAVYDLY